MDGRGFLGEKAPGPASRHKEMRMRQRFRNKSRRSPRVVPPKRSQRVCPVTEHAEPPAVPLPAEKPHRAVWLICFAAISWFLLLVLQSAFAPRAMFSADTLYFCVAAMVGAAAYLITRRTIRYKLIAAGAAALSASLLAISEAVMKNPAIYGMRVSLAKIFNMRNALIVRALPGALVAVCVALRRSPGLFLRE